MSDVMCVQDPYLSLNAHKHGDKKEVFHNAQCSRFYSSSGQRIAEKYSFQLFALQCPTLTYITTN